MALDHDSRNAHHGHSGKLRLTEFADSANTPALGGKPEVEPLKLEAWMIEQRKTASDVAAAAGVTPSAISRLIPRPGKKQLRRPGRRLAKKLKEITGGCVTADDFLDDDEPRLEACAADRTAA